MEEHLKCKLRLSLREMCLRKVVAYLWNNPEVLASALQLPSLTRPFRINANPSEPSIQVLEDKVKDEVNKLELPETLRKHMIEVVEPIGRELRKWKGICEDFGITSEEIGQLDTPIFIFNSNGIIDNRKTAYEFVRCSRLNTVKRYNLACSFCIEEYIPILWEELPESQKEVYGNIDNISPELAFCWPHILKKEQSQLDILVRASGRNVRSFNQFAFEYAASVKVNKTAAEYFFQKLRYDEREESLMITAHTLAADEISAKEYLIASVHTVASVNSRIEDASAVLFYLMSCMTPEQQMEICRCHPIQVLLHFLDWPWQVLFLENTKILWTYIPTSKYEDLQYKLMKKIWPSGHYSVKLFRDFFDQSPLDFKNSLANLNFVSAMYLLCNFLSLFSDYENWECIELLFRNVAAEDREKIVFQRIMLQSLLKHILAGNFYMVQLCVREAKVDKVKLKKALMENLRRCAGREITDRQKQLQFMDACQKVDECFEHLDKSDDSVEKK